MQIHDFQKDKVLHKETQKYPRCLICRLWVANDQNLPFRKLLYCNLLEILNFEITNINIKLFVSYFSNMIKTEVSAHEEQKLTAARPIQQYLLTANYICIQGEYQSRKKIQVFTRIGNSSKYRECNQIKPLKVASESKLRKIISKKRKSESDDDYSVKNQKKDRNVTSNLIHHLVKYLTVIYKQEQKVRKIIESNKLKILYQQFEGQLQIIGKSLKTYVTLKHIQQLWFSQSPAKADFCFIMRILSRIFFSLNGFCSVYYSNKFNIASKAVHYKGVRNLLQVLVCRDLEQLRNSLSS